MGEFVAGRIGRAPTHRVKVTISREKHASVADTDTRHDSACGPARRARYRYQRHAIDEDILLRLAANYHPPVGPAADGRVVVGAVVVVVTLVIRLHRSVGLARQRAERPSDHVIGLPGRAVVCRDPPPAPIAVLGRKAGRAVQVGPAVHFAPVVPTGEEGPVRPRRQRGLPLHGRARVGVQLDRCAPGQSGIGRADVIDVAVVGRAGASHVLAALGIVQADEVAVGHRLAPAHVPPVVRAEHAGKVGAPSTDRTPWRLECRANVGAGPGGAAVCRAVHDVLAQVELAATLNHRRHIHPATVLQVTGDLDVADKAAVDGDRRRPNGAVIGVNYLQRPAADAEVVKRYVHAPEVGAGRVVIHPHRLAVAGATTEVGRARAGDPGDTVERGPQADALAAAAGRQVASEPQIERGVVHHDRVTEVGAVAGTELLARGPGGAAVGRRGDAAIASARSAAVIVVDHTGVAVAPFHALRLGHFGKHAIRENDIYIGAADEERLRQQLLHPLGQTPVAEDSAAGRR